MAPQQINLGGTVTVNVNLAPNAQLAQLIAEVQAVQTVLLEQLTQLQLLAEYLVDRRPVTGTIKLVNVKEK